MAKEGSRFWAQSDSESDDSDSDNSSSDEELDQKKQGGMGTAKTWVMDSDSDSDDEKRKVVDKKTKQWEAMEHSVSQVRNAMKNNDWVRIQENFEEVNKIVVKQANLIKNEGGEPRFYIKMLVDLEDFLAVTLKDKVAQKKMNKANGRSLNRMKLSLRKYNAGYEAKIKEFRENPQQSEDEDEAESSDSDSDDSDDSDSDSSSDSDSDSDSDSSKSSEDEKEKKKKVESKKAKGSDDDSDSDSDNWDSESDSSSSDEEEAAAPGVTGRDRWLKKNTVVQKRERKEKDPKLQKSKKVGEVPGTSKLAFSVKDNVKEEELNDMILERVSQRGKNNDRASKLNVVSEIKICATAAEKFGAGCELPALFYLISLYMDISSKPDEYWNTDEWRTCYQALMRIMIIVEKYPEISLVQFTPDEFTAELSNVKDKAKVRAAAAKSGAVASGDGADGSPEEKKGDESAGGGAEVATEKDPVTSGEVKVMGSVFAFVNRLDSDYTMALRKINPHTDEYIERLKMESQLVKLCLCVQQYFERTNLMSEAADVALLCIEHQYYLHDSIAHGVASKVGDADNKDVSALIESLFTQTIYPHGDGRTRGRAILCMVAHHALHDRYYKARDLLLMSQIAKDIDKRDIRDKILFNRTMAMLGLCAFRAGLIKDAHQCLMDICSSRVREFLAQGVRSNQYNKQEPTEQQINEERRRQTPYHMHINQDLLEACHLISAMLLEVPNMAAEEISDRPRVISRFFRKHLDYLERFVFMGQPENTRDTVLVAAKHLMTGDWRMCAKLLLEDLDVWNLIPGEGAAATIKAMLLNKIKSEGLRTYLFSYSIHYDSLSLSHLCEMFELDKRITKSVVSKMMINQDLHASWDQTTETIVLHKVEPTRMQVIALQYADKVRKLVQFLCEKMQNFLLIDCCCCCCLFLLCRSLL